jgi:NAD(P)H-dependent FMN reductase
MAASIRSGSINQALARRIARELEARGESVWIADLTNYPLPLYNADGETRDGIPDSAVSLAHQLRDAKILVVVSPEYNGAFTPLLKNTVDWLTRIDVAVLAHLTVLVASASPGKGGGANGAAMVRQWMTNIGVTVAPRALSVGSAALGDDGEVVGVDPTELGCFVTQAVTAWRARVR